MKTIIILAVMLIQISICAQVQKIEYDFSESKFIQLPKGVKDNNTVLVVVKNYNPLRYTLSINSTALGLQYQQKPDSFKYFEITGSSTKSVESSFGDEINDFKTFYNNLITLKTEIDNLKRFRTLTKSDIDSILSENVEEIKDDSSLGDCNTLNCGYSFRMHVKYSTESIKKNKTSIQLALEELETQYKEEKDKEQKKNIETEIKDTKEELAKYLEFTKEIDKYAEELYSIISSYENLALLEYETVQDVWVEDTDRIKLKIMGNDNYLNKTIDRTIANIVVKKWFKIDFSTGGFWSRLYDEDYIKNVQTIVGEDNTTTNSYTINKLDKGRNSFGAMAFINFHTQQNTYLNYGISIGTGLLFNQSTKIVLSPTASLFFGNNQRVVLHIGVALAQVDRIISGYGDGVAFTDGNYNPVIKQYVGAEIMAGLSWNLAR